MLSLPIMHRILIYILVLSQGLTLWFGCVGIKMNQSDLIASMNHQTHLEVVSDKISEASKQCCDDFCYCVNCLCSILIAMPSYFSMNFLIKTSDDFITSLMIFDHLFSSIFKPPRFII